MNFGAPNFLYALFLVPISWFLFQRARRLRSERADLFASAHLLRHLSLDSDERRRRRKESYFLIGLLGVIFCLSHPQYGEKRTPVTREGIDIVFVLDTSLSMLAEDMLPNRLEQARREIEGLLSRLKGDRVGIVSFAGTAVPTCPLTIDYGAVRMFLRGVDPYTSSRSGTAIAKAILRATRMLVEGGGASRAIILLTDGEDHEGDVRAAAEKAKEAGARVFAVGLGASEGELIPVSRQEFKRDESGELVVTRRDDETLRELASETGGRHYVLRDQPDALDRILDALSGLEKQEYKARIAIVREEQYAWFLWPATFLIVLEAILSTAGRTRKEAWSGRIE